MHPTDEPDDEGQECLDPSSADTGFWPAIPGPESEPVGEVADRASGNGDATFAPAEPAEMLTPMEHASVPSVGEYGPRLLAAISQISQLLDDRLGALQILFDREVRAEATRERIVDRLHSELQEYKQDLLMKVQRPIFIDLIQLHDDLGKMIGAVPAEDQERAAILSPVLDSVRTAIEDILYRQGVEPFRNEGNEFDPRRQRSVNIVSTEEPDLNKTIAARIRPGFQAGDRLIRPELVAVYTLRK